MLYIILYIFIDNDITGFKANNVLTSFQGKFSGKIGRKFPNFNQTRWILFISSVSSEYLRKVCNV